jgi:hypothetical protein
MDEEGWYSDPYAVHEHRWFSDGTPTALVRDHGTTSKDPPPETPYVEEPRLIEPTVSLANHDLQRSDEAQRPPIDGVDAVWSYFARTRGF